MKKILNIAWKDLLVTLSDPAALVLTLATPFALTLVMIFAFSGVEDNSFTVIPVAIVNLDESDFGEALVEVFESDDLAELVEPTVFIEAEAARSAVDNEEYTAAVFIPADLGEHFLVAAFPPNDSKLKSENTEAVIEIYGNPTHPIGVSIVQTIVDEYINRASAIVSGAQVGLYQMIKTGLIDPENMDTAGLNFAPEDSQVDRLITLSGSLAEGNAEAGFDWLAYMAPSMAILFLMFTMSNGGRSILAEREEGTLPRMLTTPSGAAHVIGGKIFGIYLNGIAQLTVLMVASLVFFSMNWGPLNVVLPTILCVVAAATGWGMLIAAFSKTPGQASSIGTAVTLVFAIAAGNFIPRQMLPRWLQSISFISPNAWGLEAFNQIRLGAGISELFPLWAGMLGMFGVLFAASVIVFRRQYS